MRMCSNAREIAIGVAALMLLLAFAVVRSEVPGSGVATITCAYTGVGCALLPSILYDTNYRILGSFLMTIGITYAIVSFIMTEIRLHLRAIRLHLGARALSDETVSFVFGVYLLTIALVMGYGVAMGYLYIHSIIENTFIYIALTFLGLFIILKVLDIYINRRLPVVAGSKYVEYASRVENIGGFTFPIGTKAFVLISGSDPKIVEVIKLREEYHAVNRHGLKQIIFLYSALMIYVFLIKYNLGLTVLSLLYFVTMMVAFIILTRVFEVGADVYVWRHLGADDYERFKAFLKARFGVEKPWRASLWSRLTHTLRRDITLTTGDPIGAHWGLEFPLLFSLVSATSLALFFVEWPSFSPLVVPFALVGSLVVIFLFALILRPVVRRFVDLRFTDRGVLNLSALLSGLLFTTQFSSMSLGPFTYPSMYILTVYFMRHYLASWKKALSLSSVGFAALFAIDAALFLVVHRT